MLGEKHTPEMNTLVIKFILVYLPLTLLILLQGVALLALYAGKISGKDNTMIDLSTHVPALRWGWPILLVVSVAYHIWSRRQTNNHHLQS